MASRTVCCFCNNIKTYHIKGEEQFYDFTIFKDKDSVGIPSHKFLLASQSEYFAALFRNDPTASETTFENFPLDVIKKCIDYLYGHEIDLTGSNVQDVLIFADYISLNDVIAICTDYIINNIDLSDYARVIELGNDLWMDKLVQAGVFFVARNLMTNDLRIDSVDEFTKGVIMEIAERQQGQQERVTIMTTEQWNINRLKIFLSAPEMHPWLEVKLPSPVLIESVTIVNRMNACRERLRNVEVRTGMVPVPEGFTLHEGFILYDRGDNAKKLEVNSLCGYFPGPAGGTFIKEGHVIKFDQPTLAQYITVQILEAGYLQINGLKINGGDLLNINDCFQ
ncbi:hypothetical protein OS493_010483 [Desmophyllum pertusum]|uniref:BTB domain-containing protein n=1 Tax=Desmophyllum pertusum TaxID=174260 RepID=A0A9X0A3K9_9CNID|nr:hypothetical protein OS493_010483 [Desmophyllum pertusum]